MSQEKYNLNWHTYSDHLREMLHNMRISETLTDVTLVCDDQKQFKTHKIVLSACSTVFKNIIDSLPQNTSVIYLRGIQHQEMESILEFMYLGVATFYQERMNEFLNVVKNLEIKEISKDVEFNDGKESNDEQDQSETTPAHHQSDEHEEKSARLNNLLNQKSDLIDAENNLKEAIKKIDNIAQEQFFETYNKVRDNFETMFTVFFNGGKGSLELSDPDDPLNSDINIFAQPPGKRNNSLKMLSAGEKSLTAIALLFSIYQYKPSPFCILDEIDAPLDDINIKKFTDVIKDYSKSTQFIMVTHNKLTMESADCIYGVTAEKQGISKLMSIDFS